jgi:hypothetical protein
MGFEQRGRSSSNDTQESLMPVALLAACPPPFLPAPSADHHQLMERVTRFARAFSQDRVDLCFGLELRTAYLLESYSKSGNIQMPPPPYRQFYLRPAVEPIIYSYVGRLRPEAIDPDVADAFMSCLHCRRIEPRRGEIRIKPNAQGNFVQFPDAAFAADYHVRLRDALPSIEGPLNRAAFAYAEILLSHPYADGNGRLARAVAMLCLGQDDMVPFLPLGPAFYACAPRVAPALETLALTANWPHFISVFGEMVETALHLSETLLSARLEPSPFP